MDDNQQWEPHAVLRNFVIKISAYPTMSQGHFLLAVRYKGALPPTCTLSPTFLFRAAEIAVAVKSQLSLKVLVIDGFVNALRVCK